MITRTLLAAASLVLVGGYSLALAQSSAPAAGTSHAGGTAAGPAAAGAAKGPSEAGTKDITPGSGTSSTVTVNPSGSGTSGASQPTEKAQSATGGPHTQGPTAGPTQPKK